MIYNKDDSVHAQHLERLLIANKMKMPCFCGYMEGPIDTHDGRIVAAKVMGTDNIRSALDLICNLANDEKVFFYQIITEPKSKIHIRIGIL